MQIMTWRGGSIALAAAVAVACSSSGGTGPSGGTTGDSVPHSAGTTAYLGAMVGVGSGQGLITFEIADTGTTSPMTGSYKLIGGSAIAMSGSLNRGSGVLSFGGSGYGVSGTLASGLFSGAWTTSTDSGAFAAVSGSGSPLAFCGTFHDSGGTVDSGTFVLVLNNNVGYLVGANRAAGNQGEILFHATQSGSVVTLEPNSGSSSGTISGTTITGVIKNNMGTPKGSFAGDAATCAG